MQKSFWQQRYNDNDIPWNLGAPSTPLKEYIDQLTDKNLRILIPGCGMGYEAVYLAELGFTNVTAMDLVDDVFTLIRGKAPSVNCLAADIFEHRGQYDLILEQTLFCAIDPSMRDSYIAKTAELLAPGGKFVGVLFNRDFNGGPPFGGNVGEYKQYFEKYYTEFTMDECYNSIAPRAGSEVFVKAVK